MGSVSEWLDLMPDTVTVRTRESRDGYGRDEYGDPKQVRCRFRMEPEVTYDDNGEEVTANGRIWFGEDIDLDPDRVQIELPDGSTPRIVSVTKQRDETGRHHVSAAIG